MADDTDTDNDELETTEDDDGAKFARVPVDQLRSLQKKGKAAEAGAVAIRELAFVKAGIDTDSKTGKLVMAAYDGELTTDAIKAYATDIPGALVVVASPSEANPDLVEGEATSTTERNALAEGATGAEATTADPRRAARDTAVDDMREGATETNAVAGYVQRIADAASNGDQRAMVANRRG